MNTITQKMKSMKVKILKLKDSIIEKINNDVGWVLISIVVILSILDISNILVYTLSAVMVYLTLLIKYYIYHKVEKEKLDNIDLNKIAFSDNKNKSIRDIIHQYIETCFDRDVLFFEVINKDDYIDQSTEKRLLDTLIDNVLLNMSMEVRTKLAQYVGEDNLNIIIGKQCMTIVTIFTASHNQAIYKGVKDNKVVL